MRRVFPRRIPCYVLVFDQVDIVERALNALCRHSRQLDIAVIENPSANTPEIERVVRRLGRQRKIRRYYQFETNIGGNAFSAVLKREEARVRSSPYVVVTDGDLVPHDDSWLDEEIRILAENPVVFTCGISLDMSNLPIEAFPEAASWIPPDLATFPQFHRAFTGGHLLLIRGAELADFVRWQRRRKLPFVDAQMHNYCTEEAGKYWARTKHSRARHLTWDLYADPDHPYTQFKVRDGVRTLHTFAKADFRFVSFDSVAGRSLRRLRRTSRRARGMLGRTNSSSLR